MEAKLPQVISSRWYFNRVMFCRTPVAQPTTAGQDQYGQSNSRRRQHHPRPGYCGIAKHRRTSQIPAALACPKIQKAPWRQNWNVVKRGNLQKVLVPRDQIIHFTHQSRLQQLVVIRIATPQLSTCYRHPFRDRLELGEVNRPVFPADITVELRVTRRALRRLWLHKGAILQPPGPGRAFKGLGVAKRYCRRDSIGDSFVQRRPGTVALLAHIRATSTLQLGLWDRRFSTWCPRKGETGSVSDCYRLWYSERCVVR